MGRVEGKVVFITGAGQGQGRSHAIRLAEEGADIVATDICTDLPQINYIQASLEDLEETKAMVEAVGGRCVAAVADVRSRSQLQAAVDLGIEAFGQLDVVVANAGVITFHMDSLTISDELYDLILDVNLKGVWNTILTTAPEMIRSKNGGSIIITSSSAGIRGSYPFAHYVASKFGVVGLMKCFANELAKHRIRLNTIHPTGVASPGMGQDPTWSAIWNSMPELAAGGSNMLPDLDVPPGEESVRLSHMKEIEISNAVLWLASDEARYVTGVQLPVDAGNTNKP
jgi:SDR family mycofactocin-dependent oxidoreductase